MKGLTNRICLAVLLASGPVVTPGAAQTVAAPLLDTLDLSLAAALRRGLEKSEEIHLARSQVRLTQSQVRDARSALFPQLALNFSYQRTIRSPLGTGSSGPRADSLRFMPDSTAPLDARVRYIEQNADNAALESLSGLFAGFPLGQENTWLGQVTVRQTLFDGSVIAGVKATADAVGLARAQELEQEVELRLAVTEAYYDAVLADHLAAIVDSTAHQLDEQLAQVRMTRTAGNASDLDLLNVQVDRQNLEPQRVTALNQRDLALLDLRRLINLPVDQAVRLTDDLATAGFHPASDAEIAQLETEALARRAQIEVAERQVALGVQQVRAAKAAYLPTLSVLANFGLQALPQNFVPSGSDWRDDWNVGVAVQVPLFTGGSRRAQVAAAREELEQAELHLAQARETVTLDVARQRGELRRAEALIAARARTSAQARRLYSLTDLAFRQGVTSYLQLTDARLAQNQARTNEVQALHDYYIALARLQRAAGAPVSLALHGPTDATPASR